MELNNKFEMLKTNIEEMKRLAVAFSGGVDSTFLLKVAHDILQDHVIAIIAHSAIYPQWEFQEAVDFVRKNDIVYKIIEVDESKIEGFSSNPPDRCYLCKKTIFKAIDEFAKENNFYYIADGSNVDDLNDYRPGTKAVKELGIISPLKAAEMTKDDIRILSEKLGLSTWDKPSFACLASRFPYGERITRDKLKIVDTAEQYLMDLGFKQVRVRYHGDTARIEVASHERSKFISEELMDKVYEKFTQLGFLYTALDLKGYRTGSLNAGIKGL